MERSHRFGLTKTGCHGGPQKAEPPIKGREHAALPEGLDQRAVALLAGDCAVTAVDLDLKTLLGEVCNSLLEIDSKTDTIINQLDHMGDCLDKHDYRLGHLEQHVSEAENGVSAHKEQLLNLETVLAVKAKNQDLEACSRWINICVLGLPESTSLTLNEEYSESMLRAVVGDRLTELFIVECVHRFQGLRPPLGAQPTP
ncbi:hypothetical protein NDU88_007059 [Pleurodeles waltl]|uniref:Uncharacterized protein n=1 Tax=Pleurodeles waltl TaxID=8319 RepID=A0AAV7U064_PLEWA|nr:hypothetical protein NDU88_007059 [Pleurodeles waltl]